MKTDLKVLEYPLAVKATLVLNENLCGEKLSVSDLMRFRVPPGSQKTWSCSADISVTELEGVIITVLRQRVYWANPVPGKSPPDCKSNDGITGIGNPGGECASCKMNMWGSAHAGEGKACREFRILVFALPNQAIPVLVFIPPTSLGSLRRYLMLISYADKRYREVITKITLQPATTKSGISYMQAAFSPVGLLPPERVQEIEVIAKQFDQLLSVEVRPEDYFIETSSDE